MKQGGEDLRPNVITFSALITACVAVGRFDSASDLFARACADGCYRTGLSAGDSIDLHDLPVAVARVALSAAFDSVPKPCTMKIITGRGVHSAGDPVLPDAMREFVRGQGLQVEEIEGPEGLGRFRVHIL